MIPTEHEEQVAVIDWCNAMSRMHTELESIFAIPNGANKSRASAAKFKREGLKPGVLDLFLAVPKKGYSGLFIEMKRVKGGSVSEDQKIWINRLQSNGYKAVVCRGAEQAIRAICEYLNLEVSNV